MHQGQEGYHRDAIGDTCKQRKESIGLFNANCLTNISELAFLAKLGISFECSLCSFVSWPGASVHSTTLPSPLLVVSNTLHHKYNMRALLTY
jgi:hypothetical protein